ncbi:MAG: hypothetical protein HY996_03830 [Micrococcales bacterium]|nr:hypothetical protein [Micrococcales bacterium]
MTEIADAITAYVLLADYAAADQAGKLNVIGGGVTVINFDLQRGATAPFSLMLMLRVPWPAPDSEAAVEIVLLDAGDQPVQMPGPSDQSQPMRIAQNVQFTEPLVQGVRIPRGAIEAAASVVLNFGAGMPIPMGHSYSWQVSIDGEEKARVRFFVPGPPPGPVLG